MSLTPSWVVTLCLHSLERIINKCFEQQQSKTKHTKKRSAFRLTFERYIGSSVPLLSELYKYLVALEKRLQSVNTQVFSWKRVSQMDLKAARVEVEARPGELANSALRNRSGPAIFLPSKLPQGRALIKIWSPVGTFEAAWQGDFKLEVEHIEAQKQSCMQRSMRAIP